MFSDNKQIIGMSPLYEQIKDSMDSFDVYNKVGLNLSSLDNIKMLHDLVHSDLTDETNYGALHAVMNKSFNGVYWQNSKAFSWYQNIMYYDAFNKQEWETALNVVDVFDYNDAYVRFMDDFFLSIGERYLSKYAIVIYKEIMSAEAGLLHHINLTDKATFEKNILKEQERNKNTEDKITFPIPANNMNNFYGRSYLGYQVEDKETFYKVIRYIGEKIIEFNECWKYGAGTVQFRMSKTFTQLFDKSLITYKEYVL